MTSKATEEAIVVVGGGHAAAQLCVGLAEAGMAARLHLVCDEPVLPYHRPPLSKQFLRSGSEALQAIRPDTWYADSGITVHRADRAVVIDRDRGEVRLASGMAVPYGRLVLATGSRARPIAGVPDDADNVATVRSAADAVRLREKLLAANAVTVLGGGFIGLEIAATARGLGKAVTVLEMAPRLLMRSVSEDLSAAVLAFHRAAGIDVRLGVSADSIELKGDRVAGVVVEGRQVPVELLVAGIGAEPECTLAQACGLACDNGILVDAGLRTSDPAILAIGDCTRFPEAGSGLRLRLESVQNAHDQARTAVATLLGRDEPYRALPWFWSEQGALRLQMAGLMPSGSIGHRRPGANEHSFSIFHYAGERLACVESVNAPLDHMMSRKLLEAGRSPSPNEVRDPAVPLKSLL